MVDKSKEGEAPPLTTESTVKLRGQEAVRFVSLAEKERKGKAKKKKRKRMDIGEEGFESSETLRAMMKMNNDFQNMNNPLFPWMA